METATRRSDYTLEQKLFEKPYEFDFYQVIRVLTSLHPKKTFLGKENDTKNEPVQIKSSISYSVPSADVQDLSPHFLGDHPPLLTVNFLGIAGIQGPLPQPYTELLTDRLQQKDTAFRDFLDIFNHRFVSYWYLVQKKHIPGLDQIPVDKTPLGKTLLDLGGFSETILLKDVHLHSRSLINYAPLFWQRQKSVAGLYKIVKGYFKTDLIVQEFFGAWRTPPASDLTRLGNIKGQFQALGRSFIVGRRSWDSTAGIQITLKDLSWALYTKHLPGSTRNNVFRDLVHLYEGLGFILDLRATIKAEEIPAPLLGRKLYLGQTSWLTRGKGHGFNGNPSVRLLQEKG